MNGQQAVTIFEKTRPRLTRLAYRMLGSLSEAEDVVQDAYMRWHRTDREAVREPAAFLTRVVTRLCLDVKGSARARRETYVGPWLPEPIIERFGGTDEAEIDADELTFSLMVALESLSPLERAAFLLHDIFGEPFETVAETINREEAACRQLAARARAHIRAQKPRYTLSRQEGRALAEAFFQASTSGDVGKLQQLLARDVAIHADGGGRVVATINPIRGLEKAGRLYAGLAAKPSDGAAQLIEIVSIDGLPGFIARDRWGVLYTVALDIIEGKIRTVYVTRNPDKLRHIAGTRGLEQDAFKWTRLRRSFES